MTQDTDSRFIDQARGKAQDLRQRAGEFAQDARDKAGDAYGSARERAIEAYDQAREKAASAREGAGRQLNDSPLAALGAGLAVGAILGALLPRSEREKKALAAVGGRISDTARSASNAAREAGRSTLADLNLTRQAGENVVQSIVRGVGDAAKNASQAALGTVRKPD